MSLPATSAVTWIDRRPALDTWLANIDSRVIGLDTEFMRRNTFYPQLALLQIGIADRHALIDPLAFPLHDLLYPLLGNRQTITVMHSASEDLEALAPHLPDGPANLFDTQIAAAFTGLGAGISYRALVAELTGVELDKGETRSDWMQRPLTASQRRYAELDVAYLDPIYSLLQERLLRCRREVWHAEECERLKTRRREEDLQPHKNFRSAAEWPLERQAALRRILLWRERIARDINRPRPWLLEDALAVQLVEQPPHSLSALEERCRDQRALRHPQRLALWETLSTPITTAEMATTQAISRIPQGSAKKALTAMRALIDKTASAHDLPAGLLCPRKVLEDYVMTKTWPDFLQGWRTTLLQEKLPGLLPD